ncbi:MAG: EamA family transporter, partial [Candidatus Eisenbacteria bacterium]|nr:EamA family transporter [Candidatus Latescibacterota bacterium]MBD3301877.1 EamA family transporter [Candidatus Eisenbacteria bacterium]
MNLFKTGFCLPLFLATTVLAGRSLAMPPAAAGVLLFSGVIGMSIGDTFYFTGLARIGARRALMILTLSPLFAGALSAAAGQDLPGPVGSVGIGCVVAGLILVLRERPVGVARPERFGSGIALAFGASFCQALGIILTKEGLQETGVLEASTVRILGGVIGILAIAALRGRLRRTVGEALRPPALARIIPATLMGTYIGFFLLQAAVQETEPAVAAALTGTSPLFVAPLSIAFLGERMQIGGWIGTVLAVGGVALVLSS